MSYLVGRVCLSSTVDYYHDAPQSGCIPIFTFSLARYSVSLYFFQHLILFYSTIFMNLMCVKLYLICTSLMTSSVERLLRCLLAVCTSSWEVFCPCLENDRTCLFMFGCPGSSLLRGLLELRRPGLPSSCGAWPAHRSGVSGCRARL